MSGVTTGRLRAALTVRGLAGFAAAAATVAGLSAGCGGLGDHGAPVRDRVREVGSTGPERAYLVHTPPGGGAGRPVLVAFHGPGGNGRRMERLTHLDQIADRYGFTVVYPDGPRGGWPLTAGPHLATATAFVDRMVDDVVRRGHADPRRVFVVGLSTGGMFTQLLGCSSAGRLAGVAAVAGAMPAGAAQACHPARPLRVLLVHGTQDAQVPYAGGMTSARAGRVEVLSEQADADLWRRLDGCPAARPQTHDLPEKFRDGTRVSVAVTGGCGGGTGVAVYTVTGGGSAWPGGTRSQPPTLAGKPGRDFDAGQVIWRFFAQSPTA